MTMTRQARRKQERMQEKLLRKGKAFRKVNPMAEEVHRQGYEEGWSAGCNFAMKSCYAAAVMAFQDFEGWQIEGYSTARNTRFLRAMDDYIVNTLSSEEIMDEALKKTGVTINFREPFPEDRITEVVK